MATITFNPRHANWYETGRNIYSSGVHAHSAVYVSIRRLGYYLMCGDSRIGLSSVQDNEERAKIIYRILTKTLYWSVERAKELWEGILNACKWRPKDKLHRTDSTREPIVRENSNTIIYNIAPEIEQKYPSKEEIRDIFKTVLGDKLEKPVFKGFLRALRL